MLTTEQADSITDSTAIASLYYFPGVSEEIDGYDLNRQVELCLDGTPDEFAPRLRPLVTATIIDPTNNRTALLEFLMSITEDADSE